MSRDNIAVVREALAAFSRGGMDAMDDFLDPDIEWRAVEGALDDVGEMLGRDLVRAYMQDWYEAFDGLAVEVEEIIDAGDGRVVALQQVTGRGKTSGVETRLRYAVVYTVRNGRLISAREYISRKRALEAVGLEV